MADWQKKKVDHFVIMNKLLGEGQFGQVYRGYAEDDQSKQVAVKTIPIRMVQESEQLQQYIKREVSILTKIDHPNIVKLLHVTKSNTYLYMILEFCKDGDLAQYINKKQDKRLSELESVIFFKHVIKGFEQLHKNNVIHRDIKPSNILLHDGIAKIADFGFARIVEPEVQAMQNLSRVGSPIYMAPQILEGQAFTSKCDIWSIGVMFYELLYGVTPWIANGQCELLDKILNQPLVFPEIPVRSQKVKNLLRKMLIVDENQRIAWEELFNNEIVCIDENQIQYNMKLIEMEKDRLMRSVSLNKIYVKQNLIMGYMQDTDKNTVEIEQSELPNPKDFNNMQDYYQAESITASIIQKLNSICKYERNLALYYSYVIQNLFALMQQNVLPISLELLFQLIFCISKNQLIKMEDIFRDITKQQSDEHKAYMKSQEFKQMYKHLGLDIDQARIFFVEILRKCLSLQNQAKQIVLNEQSKEFYQAYLYNLDNNLVLTDSFKTVYTGTIKLILDKLNTENIELLKLKYFLVICLNPKAVFIDYQYDFSKFYEDVGSLTIEDLKKMIPKIKY